MNETMQNYRKVYQMLEDSESRDIYLNKMCYWVSYNLNYIKNVVTSYVPQFIPLLEDEQIRKNIALLPTDRDFVLYGAGVDGARLLPYCENNTHFIGFCSRTLEKQRYGYLGYPVISPKELLARKDLYVIISAKKSKEDIMQILENGGYPKEQILDVSVFCGPMVSDPGQYFNPSFMTYEDEEVFVDAGCYDLAPP